MPARQRREKVVVKLIQAKNEIEDALAIAGSAARYEVEVLSGTARDALNSIILSIEKIIETPHEAALGEGEESFNAGTENEVP